jgi:predicted tellurium resistance membrane protein TerC
MNATTVWELLGLTGIILFFAGLHMLWRAREEVFFWLEEYFRLLRLSVHRATDPLPIQVPPALPRTKRKHTLQMVIGVLLAFIAAPMLLTVGLTMVWLSRRGG